MPNTTYSKTVGRALLAHTQLTSGLIVPSSALSVAGYLAATLSVSLGRSIATALTNEVLFKLRYRAKGSGNDEWFDLVPPWTSANGKTACNATTLSASASAGATTIAVTSATGIAKGSKLYLRETGTPGDSEWIEVKDISGTTVTPMAALERAHASGITVTTLYERYVRTVSLPAQVDLQFVADAGTSTSGQTVDVIAWLSTLDMAVSA